MILMSKARSETKSPGKEIAPRAAGPLAHKISAVGAPAAESPPLSFDNLDRVVRAGMGRMTQGVSPHALSAVWFDWISHLARAPGRQLDLALTASTNAARLARYATRWFGDQRPAPPFHAREGDKRFAAPEWKDWPFDIYAQSFLALENYWELAARKIRGMSTVHADRIAFLARQGLDMISPSNHPLLNPVILDTTWEQGGVNFLRGFSNFMDDWSRTLTGERPEILERFKVGKNLAVTEGAVVYRNELMEVIQYSPKTENVYAEPI